MSPGQRGDPPLAQGLLERLPPARLCAGDAAYDSDRLRLFLIERMFCRLKDWRRIATRYDKLASNFAAAVILAAIVIWWI